MAATEKLYKVCAEALNALHRRAAEHGC